MKLQVQMFNDGASTNYKNTMDYLLNGELSPYIQYNVTHNKLIEEYELTHDAIELYTILANKQKTPNLSATSYTNIAKMYMNARTGYNKEENITYLPIYTEGVGTITGIPDTNVICQFGNMTGRGPAGSLAKYIQAMIYLNSELEKIISSLKRHGDKEVSLVFDIYGFSRGCGVGRHMANMINKRDDIFTDLILDEFYKHDIRVSKVEVNTLVLIDTVVQVYDLPDLSKLDKPFESLLEHEIMSILGIDKASETTGNIDVSLNNDSCKKCYHFISNLEVRHNFPLHLVPADNDIFKTITLLGVHADLGGGYAITDTTPSNITYPVVTSSSNTTDGIKDSLLTNLVNQIGHNKLYSTIYRNGYSFKNAPVEPSNVYINYMNFPNKPTPMLENVNLLIIYNTVKHDTLLNNSLLTYTELLASKEFNDYYKHITTNVSNGVYVFKMTDSFYDIIKGQGHMSSNITSILPMDYVLEINKKLGDINNFDITKMFFINRPNYNWVRTIYNN